MRNIEVAEMAENYICRRDAEAQRKRKGFLFLLNGGTVGMRSVVPLFKKQIPWFSFLCVSASLRQMEFSAASATSSISRI